VEEHETASASGLQNFLRTLAGAVATSIVTTAWEDKTSIIHAELVGLVDRTGATAGVLGNSGMPPDAVGNMLDRLLTGQSVMLATNHIVGVVAVVFAVSACLIWFAPKPSRAVDMTHAGH
jgi:DHA2 family multidrug resistance protein